MNQKGITLVALVVTIIVLLILAGVTINMILGDDGIIKQAQTSTILHELKEIQERVDIEIATKKLDAKNKGDEFNISEYKTLGSLGLTEYSKYDEIIGIENGQIYIKANADESIKQIAMSAGIDVRTIIEKNEEKDIDIESVKVSTLKDYKIYGNSVQDGTPSPQSPKEIKSVGNLVTQGENAGKYEIPITISSGKNLYNGEIVNYAVGTLNNATQILANQAYRGFYVEIKPGNTYSISRDKVSTNRFRATFISEIPKSGVVCLDLKGTVNTYDNALKIENLVAPSNAKYLFVYLSNSSENVSDTKIQVELGATATEYEEYKGFTTSIYLDEPLRKVGDDFDCIDFETKQVVRKVAYYEIPTDRSWSQYPDSEGKTCPCLFMGVYGLSPTRDASKTVIFTHDIITDYQVLYGIRRGLWPHNNQTNNYFFYWGIPYDVLGTTSSTTSTDNATAIKSYCNNEIAEGRIPKIYYVRKTIEYKPIELPILPLYEGENTITINTEVSPSKVIVEY